MGRLADRIPPRGSKADIIPRGTPAPKTLSILVAEKVGYSDGYLQVKSVEPCATTTEIRTELMMQVLDGWY